jgi:hypothetical protein
MKWYNSFFLKKNLKITKKKKKKKKLKIDLLIDFCL